MKKFYQGLRTLKINGAGVINIFFITVYGIWIDDKDGTIEIAIKDDFNSLRDAIWAISSNFKCITISNNTFKNEFGENVRKINFHAKEDEVAFKKSKIIRI